MKIFVQTLLFNSSMQLQKFISLYVFGFTVPFADFTIEFLFLQIEFEFAGNMNKEYVSGFLIPNPFTGGQLTVDSIRISIQITVTRQTSFRYRYQKIKN